MEATGAKIHRYLGKPARIILKPTKKLSLHSTIQNMSVSECFNIYSACLKFRKSRRNWNMKYFAPRITDSSGEKLVVWNKKTAFWILHKQIHELCKCRWIAHPHFMYFKIKHYCDCALCESMISLHGPRFWILPEYISWNEEMLKVAMLDSILTYRPIGIGTTKTVVFPVFGESNRRTPRIPLLLSGKRSKPWRRTRMTKPATWLGLVRFFGRWKLKELKRLKWCWVIFSGNSDFTHRCGVGYIIRQLQSIWNRVQGRRILNCRLCELNQPKRQTMVVALVA